MSVTCALCRMACELASRSSMRCPSGRSWSFCAFSHSLAAFSRRKALAAPQVASACPMVRWIAGWSRSSVCSCGFFRVAISIAASSAERATPSATIPNPEPKNRLRGMR